MYEYIVEPKSRADLRKIANELREKLDLSDALYFPIVEMLDVMSIVFPDFNYEIVKDNTLKLENHAETNINTGLITIKESIYERACKGEGRDRMTIAHEIGHFITIKYYKFNICKNTSGNPIPTFRDPEWQAKCFAGELMIPKHLINGMSVPEIAKKCGVSEDAARYQCEKYKDYDTYFFIND